MLIIWFISCKDNKVEPLNNNEFKAEVLLSSGAIVKIVATGKKALIECSLLGNTFLEGTNEANAAVYLSNNGQKCINNTGTYSFVCQYRVNAVNQNTPIFTSLADNPGSITFTQINDHYMEGNFTATCLCESPGCTFGIDSVVVSGSFKGNRFSN